VDMHVQQLDQYMKKSDEVIRKGHFLACCYSCLSVFKAWASLLSYSVINIKLCGFYQRKKLPLRH